MLTRAQPIVQPASACFHDVHLMAYRRCRAKGPRGLAPAPTASRVRALPMAAPPVFPERPWQRLLRPQLVLVLFVVSRLPGLWDPVAGQHHKWRQADTAAVARNLAFEHFDVAPDLGTARSYPARVLHARGVPQ